MTTSSGWRGVFGDHKADPAVRVLLLDEGFMSGAHTAWGLHRAGCSVTGLAGTGGKGGHAKRGLRWTLAPRVGSGGFLGAVTRAVTQGGFDRLLPCTEPILYRIWDSDPWWRDLVFPSTLQWQRELLRSKRRLTEWAERIGVPVPRYRPVGCAEDAQQSVEAFGLPLVVKGIRGRGGAATWIAQSLDAARDATMHLLASGTECFSQEYVRGATYLVGGLFHEGQPLRLYAGEKLLQVPPRTGPAARIRSTNDPRLLTSALTIFGSLRWSGLASADFIRDPDGAYLFLEVNPRPWGSIPAAESAGVDLFTPLARLLLGEVPPADLRFRVGVVSSVFPLVLLAPPAWRRLRALRDAGTELCGSQGGLWRNPRRAFHLLHRLYRAGRNWPRA